MKATRRRISVLYVLYCATLHGTFAAEANTIVATTSRRLDEGSSKIAFLFTESGTISGEVPFSDPTGMSSLPVSLATFGASFFVGDFESQRILKFHRDGTPLGVFSELRSDVMGTTETLGLGYIESDSVGNIYATKAGYAGRPRTSLKFDSTGKIVATFAHPRLNNPRAIEADANGNVYINHYGESVYKFSSTGDFIGVLSLPMIRNASGMAIDESRGILYVTDEFDDKADVKAYSIGANSLTYIRGYDLPRLAVGISFSDTTQHLYVTQNYFDPIAPPYVIEMSTDGILVKTFEPSLTPVSAVFDVVHVIPEPSTLLLALAGFGMLAIRRR